MQQGLDSAFLSAALLELLDRPGESQKEADLRGEGRVCVGREWERRLGKGEVNRQVQIQT